VSSLGRAIKPLSEADMCKVINITPPTPQGIRSLLPICLLLPLGEATLAPEDFASPHFVATQELMCYY
jgi:hypothetical protein